VQILRDLRVSGIAQVIVVLTRRVVAGNPSAAVVSLGKHFVSSDLSQNSALARAVGKLGGPLPPVRYFKHLGIALGTVDRRGYTALRADRDRVERVLSAPVLSLIRPRNVAAAALRTRVTWGIGFLDAPALWAEGVTGKGVLVGHLDTGADGRHPALRGAIAAFTEFDDFGREVHPPPRPHDTDEHGTHTAATIAGRKVGGRSVGVAPGATLASAIVIEGGNAVARVLGGMDWAVGKGVRVLSMSLGFRGYIEDFLPITRILRERNILPVFAVGNEGPGTSRSPGNYAAALSVGAVDEEGAIADFSSSHRFTRKKDPIVPDLAAPGVGVISAKPGGGWQAMDGTSMATPHVAGLAALLFQARPDATATQVERAIFRSCARGPGVSRERGNRGIPHAPRALRELKKKAR
jgi:subtilisin family serine protease